MQRDWFCNKCTLQFDKKYVFDLHLSLVHGEKIKLKSEPQDSKENHQEFQRSENNCSDLEVVTSLKCDVCDSFFKTKKNLKEHISPVHEGKKPFKCEICETCFTEKRTLKNHIASVHGEKRPFHCNICDAVFTEKKKHECTHCHSS